MARLFTIKEAKELVEAHKELQTKLETYSEIYTKKKQEIEDYIKEINLYEKLSQYMLKCIMQKTEIPIDSELKQLILKLYVYKENQKIAEKISGIKDQQGKEMAEKMRELSRFGTTRLQWIFVTKNKKRKQKIIFIN